MPNFSDPTDVPVTWEPWLKKKRRRKSNLCRRWRRLKKKLDKPDGVKGSIYAALRRAANARNAPPIVVLELWNNINNDAVENPITFGRGRGWKDKPFGSNQL